MPPQVLELNSYVRKAKDNPSPKVSTETSPEDPDLVASNPSTIMNDTLELEASSSELSAPEDHVNFALLHEEASDDEDVPEDDDNEDELYVHSHNPTLKIEEIGDEELACKSCHVLSHPRTKLIILAFAAIPGACTVEEAKTVRKNLRDVGPAAFCEKYIYSGELDVKQVLMALGVRPPKHLEGLDDDAYWGILGAAICRQLGKRIKLTDFNTVDDAIELLQRSRNIVVLTGAGISTSLGIPDFRSEKTGLYSQLSKLDLDISDPQEVFDIRVFRREPKIFYRVAQDILPDDKQKGTPTHAFIRLLQDKGKLLTNYTQNIDNLEAKVGIIPEKLIQCHGSFATASCIECHHQVPGDNIFDEIRSGIIPKCTNPSCTKLNLAPGKLKRKRTSNGQLPKRSKKHSDSDSSDEGYDLPEAGIMKPDITFFGEELPDRFAERLTNHDKDKVDLVLVIGTSLKVAPVSEVVPYLPAHIPQIYISRTPVQHINFDITLLGDCDVVIQELCRRLDWKLDHDMLAPESEISVEQAVGRCQHTFTRVKGEEKVKGEAVKEEG